ncbi:fumarylacetoacetate hydrolase domain-containing protein 2-like [Pectinophora gossypiella]|uniref:fumarylacetoacetate hydrolase domain-containing protein 2-like n=1 Tax=Pectinophora gossypiella TaxID=13191 RepID=UPI00214F4EDC|nr:fumarylacetoacetate hydrolase domain-containing protein 2-like [Pectinophora gossypiella]
MKVIQFAYNEKPEDVRVGYIIEDTIIDVNKADTSLSTSLLQILKDGDFDKVKKITPLSHLPTVPRSEVTLKAPITGQDKVLCIDMNYLDHYTEQKIEPPEVPIAFAKFTSCIIGPEDVVRLKTNVTTKVDWEVELCLVIGKTAQDVRAEDAYKYVLGFTVAQDITARDWQKKLNGGQFLLGKAMDTFCPIGPCITTIDEIGDPENLEIFCSVNGILKQKSNTKQLVHKIPALIERLSSVITLLPGDIILTGTPGGLGMYRNPPEYLRPGDVIRSEIEKIGVLTTRVQEF